MRRSFQKLNSSVINSLGTPYDAVSVMHYREYAFSVNGRKTLESKHGIPLRGPELSPTDVKQARLLYRCPAGDFNSVSTVCLYVYGIPNLTCMLCMHGYDSVMYVV